MDATPRVRPEDEGDGFYTKVITLRNGRKLHAAAYGPLKRFTAALAARSRSARTDQRF
jgi:hypothetical protein